MSNREFFLKTFRGDRPAFVKVIRALPSDQLGYKPHEKNSAAGDIAWLLAVELRSLVEAYDTGDTHWAGDPRPQSVDEIAAEYEKQADALEKRLESASDADWDDKDCGMYYQGKKVMSMKWGAMCWSFFLDGVHHRGQLTAYLRPMGGKVPAVYGPSADEAGGL